MEYILSKFWGLLNEKNRPKLLAIFVLFTSVLYSFMHGRKEHNKMLEVNE